jgi:hypothetical protein
VLAREIRVGAGGLVDAKIFAHPSAHDRDGRAAVDRILQQHAPMRELVALVQLVRDADRDFAGAERLEHVRVALKEQQASLDIAPRPPHERGDAIGIAAAVLLEQLGEEHRLVGRRDFLSR